MKLFVLFAVLTFAALVQANPLVLAQTGPQGTFLSVTNTQELAFGFTLGQAYDNVTIQMLAAGNPTIGEAYLSTAIGPGTTLAQEVTLESYTVVGPRFASGTYQNILTLAHLNAGTYYVELYNGGSYGGDFYGSFSPAVSGDAGNTSLGGFLALGAGAINVSDPLASTFGRDVSWDFKITATETPTGVPEPMSMLLLGTGLVGLAGKFRKRAA